MPGVSGKAAWKITKPRTAAAKFPLQAASCAVKILTRSSIFFPMKVSFWLRIVNFTDRAFVHNLAIAHHCRLILPLRCTNLCYHLPLTTEHNSDVRCSDSVRGGKMREESMSPSGETFALPAESESAAEFQRIALLAQAAACRRKRDCGGDGVGLCRRRHGRDRCRYGG